MEYIVDLLQNCVINQRSSDQISLEIFFLRLVKSFDANIVNFVLIVKKIASSSLNITKTPQHFPVVYLIHSNNHNSVFVKNMNWNIYGQSHTEDLTEKMNAYLLITYNSRLSWNTSWIYCRIDSVQINT